MRLVQLECAVTKLMFTFTVIISVARNLSWGGALFEARTAEIRGQRPRAGAEFLGRGQ